MFCRNSLCSELNTQDIHTGMESMNAYFPGPSYVSAAASSEDDVRPISHGFGGAFRRP
jgi:hypothetical protein